MNASEQIDELIAGMTDWRGKTLAELRSIIHEADPDIVEEWKWRGAPVYSHDGIVCLTVPFKDKVKVTFYEGASLPDPGKLFNNELEGNKWRAIDLFKDDKIDEKSFSVLVRSAINHNQSKAKTKIKASGTRSTAPKKSAK